MEPCRSRRHELRTILTRHFMCCAIRTEAAAGAAILCISFQQELERPTAGASPYPAHESIHTGVRHRIASHLKFPDGEDAVERLGAAKNGRQFSSLFERSLHLEPLFVHGMRLFATVYVSLTVFTAILAIEFTG